MKLAIKPEFDEKLKKLRVKTRFLNNLKRERSNPEETLNYLNKKTRFYYFIISAFYWHNTPEGYDYWHEISKKIIES